MFFDKQKLTGKVSICISTFKDSRYIIELCLKTIKKYTVYPDYQIIVCDSGVDAPTREYLVGLAENGEISKLIKASPDLYHKDSLVEAVDTPYYILLHDDIKIFKKGWLTKRLRILNRNEKTAIVSTIIKNYNNGKRIFPLGALVRTDISRKLGLKWAKDYEKDLDAGGIAYKIMFSQYEYKFVKYKFSKDIYHFSEMSLAKKKRS